MPKELNGLRGIVTLVPNDFSFLFTLVQAKRLGNEGDMGGAGPNRTKM